MLNQGQQISVYKIKEVLSEKATHTCCLTEDPFFQSSVLLKAYSVSFLKDKQQQKRLETHLEKLLLIEHSSIAPIFDSGFEGEYFYYTTNYNCEAPLLEQTKGGLSSERVLKIVRDLGGALEYAVERGLEPGSLVADDIYFGDEDRVVIADFGIEYSFKCFMENQEFEWTEEQALQDLGRFQLQLLRPSKMDNLGRELEIISGIENKKLQKLMERYFTENQDRYQSFSELIDAIDVVLEQPPLETRPMVQQKSIAVSSDTGITDQQRGQVLPHVRQIITEKNLYKNLLDEALLEQSKIKDQLKETLLKLDQFTQPQLIAPESPTSGNRKKIAVWAFVGFSFGVLFSGSYGYSLQQKNSKLLPQEALVEKQINKVQPELVTLNAAAEIVEKTALDKVFLPANELISEKTEPSLGRSSEDIPVIVGQQQQWWPAGQEFSETVPEARLTVPMETSVKNDSMARGLSQEERKDIFQDLLHWAKAWSEQNSSVYFSHYSDQYRPELGKSRDEWLKVRTSRLQRPDWIKVQVEDIGIRKVAINQVQVKFQQTYHSNFYQDQIWKSLNLIKENGRWQILTERSLGRVDFLASR